MLHSLSRETDGHERTMNPNMMISMRSLHLSNRQTMLAPFVAEVQRRSSTMTRLPIDSLPARTIRQGPDAVSPAVRYIRTLYPSA